MDDTTAPAGQEAKNKIVGAVSILIETIRVEYKALGKSAS